MIIFLETYVEKFQKYFWVFYWNLYLKTDSANLLTIFSVNDFNTRICENFYVIFLRNLSNNNVQIALGKTQHAENHNPKDRHWEIELMNPESS